MGRNSGDTGGMRAGKRSHAVEHASADCHFSRLGAGLARPQRRPVSALSRCIRFSTSERRWQLLTFFHSRLPLFAMASIAALRHAAPGVISARGAAPSRGGNRRTARLGVVCAVASNGAHWRAGWQPAEQVGLCISAPRDERIYATTPNNTPRIQYLKLPPPYYLFSSHRRLTQNPNNITNKER